ncbi:hypothetical protein BCEP4_2660004 [Burkholderia cepacia]|nr:hypothetical protein BCEP4_2660004 [Burkholderia cepacia]
MDELSTPEVNAHVRIDFPARIEKYEIAYTQLGALNPPTFGCHACRRSADIQRGCMVKNVENEATAIKAGLRRSSPVPVMHTDQAQRFRSQTFQRRFHCYRGIRFARQR